MNKKREYTHEDMEQLGEIINELRLIANQVEQDIANGLISHEQWVAAVRKLMDHKKEVMAILSDVERYKSELCEQVKRNMNYYRKRRKKLHPQRLSLDIIIRLSDFSEYVENILTRMMNGDDNYESMIPCNYNPGQEQEKRAA